MPGGGMELSRGWIICSCKNKQGENQIMMRILGWKNNTGEEKHLDLKPYTTQLIHSLDCTSGIYMSKNLIVFNYAKII